MAQLRVAREFSACANGCLLTWFLFPFAGDASLEGGTLDGGSDALD
jgi:hypothetical protein